jgi:hypothetical protein
MTRMTEMTTLDSTREVTVKAMNHVLLPWILPVPLRGIIITRFLLIMMMMMMTSEIYCEESIKRRFLKRRFERLTLNVKSRMRDWMRFWKSSWTQEQETHMFFSKVYPVCLFIWIWFCSSLWISFVKVMFSLFEKTWKKAARWVYLMISQEFPFFVLSSSSSHHLLFSPFFYFSHNLISAFPTRFAPHQWLPDILDNPFSLHSIQQKRRRNDTKKTFGNESQ